MNYLASYPMLNLGAAGRIPIILPVLDQTHPTTRVPKTTGPLAGASYDLIAQAQDAKDQAAPADPVVVTRRQPGRNRGGLELDAARRARCPPRAARSRSRRWRARPCTPRS